jgi:serine O-acetyltransferase
VSQKNKVSTSTDKRKMHQDFWKEIKSQARTVVKAEPFLNKFFIHQVHEHDSLCQALAHQLSLKLDHHSLDSCEVEILLLDAFQRSDNLLWAACEDMKAYVDRDPACKYYLEPLLFFKGFQALQVYRASHVYWRRGKKMTAKLLQSLAAQSFSVDIHPAARIGTGILIDHATNLVIGETAKVGDNVSILHGVTLGGTGKESGDRHPKIGHGVLLSAHAQLLGNIKVGNNAKIGAGAVVLVDVPNHTTYAGVPAKMVGKPSGDIPALCMESNFVWDSDLESV